MDYIRHYDSPLGRILLAADGSGLTGLWFEGQRFYAETLSPVHGEGTLPVLDQTAEWLDIYFSGAVPDFTPPLHMRTTPFRRAVWEVLLTIPYGRTMTYGKIARILAEKGSPARLSPQAVGTAVGHNAISLIIPCHRVVGAGGRLAGYAGGLDKKARLLTLEKAEFRHDGQQKADPGKSG